MDEGRADKLADHIRETAQAIAELHATHRLESTSGERWLEQVVSYVATPWFLLLLTLAVMIWIVANLVSTGADLAFDPPPYPLLQGVLTLLGVYVALAILTAQRRAGVLEDLRAKLTLEHSILAEHKAAKIVELLEELRRDDPTIANRADQLAEKLATPSDPKAVAAALVESHAKMEHEQEERKDESRTDGP